MEQIDEQILLFFNGYHTPWLDATMKAITGRWIWVPFYVVLAGMLIWRFGWRRALVYLLSIGIVITLSDQICAHLIRPIVERLRPCSPDNPLSASLQLVNGYAPRSYSFPSCHGANTFALATFISLAMRSKGLTIFMFIWAAVVSCSRLYLGVHYPSDILTGAAIGSTIALFMYWITTKIKFGRRELSAVILLLAASGAQAQKFEWGGEFATIFDNREGNAKHTSAETYFLTRLAPEVGISFDGGQHRVMGGVVWTQPIGCEWEGHRVSPTLYYRYQTRKLRGSLGMFPRTQLLRQLPEYLVSDSTAYFQHNLRGALLQSVGCNGFFEFLLDWRGMQSETRREAFSIVAQGEFARKHKVLIAGGTAMLNHLAKVKHAPADQYVVDNLNINPYLGVDFRPVLKPWRLWSALSLRVGPMSSLTRDRIDHKWRSAVGVRSEIDATYWRVTLCNVTWVGNKPLFPLYAKFGAQLNEGEPFYASRWYNRTELSALLVRYRKVVDLKAEMDFHFADQNDFMFYQRIILTVNI